MEGMNIYQRLNKIREAVSYIQKDAKVTGYKAITHDMVTSEVRPHLIKYGVIIVPREVKGELRDTGKATSGGTPFTAYIAVYEIDFVNMDDPPDKVTVCVSAIGEDQNDKGPGKAVSYATKTAILKLLSIETGESDESRQELKPNPITVEQIQNITNLMHETGSDEAKFLKYLKIDKLDTMPTSKYAAAVAALEKKKGKPDAGA